MTTRNLLSLLACAALFSLAACNNDGGSATTSDSTSTTSMDTAMQIKEEAVTYTGDTTFNGFVAYDASKEGKRPAVLVVHEWWGLNDYPKMRARELAKLGYIAMAVDMYGGGKTAANPQEAMALASPFYQNPQMAKTRLEAALAQLKTYAQTDTANIAAIGYCYGGFIVLNAAKQGTPLNGVVSFHGNLGGVAPDKNLMKAKVLVCHGEADGMVPPAEIAAFKKSMDSVGAVYTFKTYPGATHAFTNPKATETGKQFNMPIEYNGAADTASWNDMKQFFGTVFK